MSYVEETAVFNSELAVAHCDQDLYAVLLDSLVEVAVFAVTINGTILNWNAGAQRIFGYSHAAIVGHTYHAIFTAEDIAAAVPELEIARALRDGVFEQDRWHVRQDGSRFWGTNTVKALYKRNGELLGCMKLVRDTTVSYLAKQQINDTEQRLQLLFSSVRDYAIFSLATDGTITSWSLGAEQVFGYAEHEIIGSHIAALYSPVDVAGSNIFVGLQQAATGIPIDISGWLVRKNATSFPASGKINKLQTNATGEMRGYVVVVHDTTEVYFAVEEMRRQANADALTDLANRRAFETHVARAIASVKRRASSLFAVLFIDLDGFKSVNDKFGHVVADSVLIAIARRLEVSLRSEDIVARLGGDEFAILLTRIDSVGDADDAANRVLHNMQDPIKTESGDVFARVSIGIVIGTAKYDLPLDLMRDADAAMYAAKAGGRARAVIFDAAIEKTTQATLDFTTSLRVAVEQDQLRLVYQPIVRLADSQVVGVEALVRWKHPQRGLLLPADFIARSEQSNLVFTIDRWVIARATSQLALWLSRGIVMPKFQMSVNISSKELTRDGFFEDLCACLRVHSLDPHSIRLEITETVMLERSLRSHQALATIRAYGIMVDVDDFGTGYASFGSLNHIVVDGLKVDWSFVRTTDARYGWEIVEAVISLAHKLGLVATAEGIETSEQLQRLISLGCDFGQGYLFAGGLGPVAATAFLREKAPSSCGTMPHENRPNEMAPMKASQQR